MISRKRLALGGLLAAIVLGGSIVTLQLPRWREAQVAHWPLERLSQEALEHPEDGALQLAAARRLLAAGRKDEALSTGRAAVRAANSDAGVWAAFAEIALEAGADAEGLAAARRALELNPKAAEAHFALGGYYARNQSSHGAVDQYRQYAALRPGDPRGWVELARAFLELNEPGNILDAANHALSLRPADPDALYLAGEASRRLGKLPEAETLLRRAVEQRPHFGAALAALGQVKLASARGPQEVAAATTLLEQAVAEAPGDEAARYQLGTALAQQGKWSEAARQWEQALRDAPGDQRSRMALAQAYAHLGRAADSAAQQAAYEKQNRYQAEVEAALDRLRSAKNPAEAQFALARVHLQYGHEAEAAAALRAGLAADPGNEWANKTLARFQAHAAEATPR